MNLSQDNQNSVILIAESTFRSFPPNCLIRGENDALSIAPSSVATVISSDVEFSNFPKCSVVQSVGNVEDIRRQICSKPLVLTVSCCKHVPQGQRLNSRGEYLSFRDKEWWLMSDNSPWMNPYTNPVWGTGTTSLYGDEWISPRFVVIVDTTNPVIRQKLNEGFDRVSSLMAQQKNFALEFDFNPMILEWWKNQGPSRYDQIECLTLTAVTGATFTVTNSTPIRHCFDCHTVWCVCWPAYCLIAIPYKIWRNLMNGIHDVIVKMTGNVVVAHPNSHGYGLETFFRTPIKNTQPGILQTSERTAVDCGIESVQAKSMLGNPRMRVS
ncbi:uncharacterized protein LOC116302470 [Actinia tenebrosa]|uniref:Uncharacterized protein LOC116302470 n=1 Tax=Actinia tenebrosa TaxID=6105 RepID=A0A6P8IKY9_ACTTE|nr:uncharacterized protein LOC116302470 [Actinia tenebrosa]